MKLIDLARIEEGDAEDLCPHCVIGGSTTGEGGYWCNAREKPIYVPSTGNEPCTKEDWAFCPLNFGR